jgi:Secretion system C-terminal sorting domain/SprB repeat
MKTTTNLLRAFVLALIISFSFTQVKATPLSVVVTSQTDVGCYGQNNGNAMVTASGGTTPYTYLWAPTGQTRATAIALAAGTYTVSVWDANAATASITVTITQPPLLTVVANVMTEIACNGGNNGQVSAIASGGVSQFQYAYVWFPGGTTSDTTSGLTAGCYTVITTDAAGCLATAVTCITQPSVLTATINQYELIFCNAGTGALVCTPADGTYPYTYSWSNGSTDSVATGLIAGSYSMQVTDNNGCTASAAYTLTQPSVFTATPSSVNNTNCMSPNGEAIVSASGGTLPYYYLWSCNQYSDTAKGLSPGTYTCIVTDSYSCMVTDTVIVAGTPAPFLTLTSTPDSDAQCVGTATASVTGGVPPYTYLWSPGGYTNSTINNLCMNFYSCIVTDNAGCTDSNSVMVDTCCMVYCSNNYDEPICIVTLDTATNKCEVVWGRTNSPPSGGYGNYNIYRDTGAGYSLINSQPLNVMSDYIDMGSNPSAGPVSYELSTVDSCGESTLSSPHTSIYLTTTAALNVYILNWTAYVGFTPSRYIIYRGPSLDSLKAIDSVLSNVLTYHDTLPPLGSYYVLEAESPNGPCIPSAHHPGKPSISLLSGAFSNGFNTGTLLGINNLGNNISNLKVYPNPNNGMFTLSYSMNGGDNITVSIINELGQTVYIEQKQANKGVVSEQLNVENLARGIYTLRIQTNKGISVSKLAIMQK